MRGRPKKENSRNRRYIFRMTTEEYKKLEDLCKETGMSKPQVLRKALNNFYLLKIFGIVTHR